MANQTDKWLKRTILWQRCIFLFLGLVWMIYLGAMGAEFLLNDIPILSIRFLLFIVFTLATFSWSGYILSRLYKSIVATKAYSNTEKNIHWQDAMQQQLLFWKYIVLTVLVGFGMLMLLLVYAIIVPL